jgi:oligopeptide/dipeptide ABC transporter ATP-binding protein
MYLGRFVEEGRWDQVLSKPAHPYTRALLASVPGMHKTGAARARMTGEAPSALRPPPGCAFHPRGPVAVDACRSGAGPGITGTAEGHQARCHLLQQGVTA